MIGTSMMHILCIQNETANVADHVLAWSLDTSFVGRALTCL